MAAFRITELFKEARRRRVFRTLALYVVGAWVALQVADLAFPGLGIAESAIRYVWIACIMGLPVALVFAWRYDIVGGKIIRTPASGVEVDLSIGRADYVVLAALAVVVTVIASGLVAKLSDTQVTATAQFSITEIDPKSIAVLPFVNMSGDEDNTYFSHGMSEELLNVLTRIPGLKVSSRTSSFHFAGLDVPLREIAAKLAVRHILEGSVRRSGSSVRITAQLIDAETDTHLWSKTYDRDVLDMFVVQSEIAAEIVDELQLNLIIPIRSARPTENEEAYDKYLRGWHFMRQGWGRDDFLAARKYFGEATELDPEFAQAHALLSLTETSLGNFRHLAPKDVFPRAYASASAAVALDETSPEAHIAMGWLALSYQFDWEKAAEEFRRAIELAPSNFIGYNGLSFALQTGGRLDEALVASKRVFELDPMMVWSRNGLAEVYFKQRDYEAATRHVTAILEMQPEDPLTLAWLGMIHAANGLQAEALEYTRQAAEYTDGDPNLELYLAGLHAQLGNEAEARRLLEEALAQRDSVFVSPGSIAIVYTHLGEYDQAIDWLYEAVEAYDSFIFNLGYPDFDALRSDPRFIELCDHLSMPCAEQ
jgi:serine/threonine-protein kinase